MTLLQVGINIDEFPGIQDDMDFTQTMIAEQSVFCLPGKVGDNPVDVVVYATHTCCTYVHMVRVLGEVVFRSVRFLALCAK